MTCPIRKAGVKSRKGKFQHPRRMAQGKKKDKDKCSLNTSQATPAGPLPRQYKHSAFTKPGMTSKTLRMEFNQSSQDSALGITLISDPSFFSEEMLLKSEWKSLLINHNFPKFYSIQTPSPLICLLTASSPSQVHLKERLKLLPPYYQGKEKQRRKEKATRK